MNAIVVTIVISATLTANKNKCSGGGGRIYERKRSRKKESKLSRKMERGVDINQAPDPVFPRGQLPGRANAGELSAKLLSVTCNAGNLGISSVVAALKAVVLSPIYPWV